MSFIKFDRNPNGRVSLGNLNDHAASNKAANKARRFELGQETVTGLRNIVDKKTTPKVSKQDLTDLFADLDHSDKLPKKK